MPLVAAPPRPGVVWIAWSFAHSPTAIWSALTEPQSIARWLGDAVTCDIRPGGELVVDHGDGVRSRSEVIAAEPPQHLAMTWEFPDEPASKVTFTIRPHDDGAVLELEHAVVAELADSYRAGWFTHLIYLEAVTDGEPLPASQFWKLDATLVRGFGGDAQPGGTSLAPARPEIVCICGSMRFRAEMRDAARDLGLAGVTVVAPAEVEGPIDAKQKAALDALHLRKIDLADRVLIVNPDGYVGESTRREMAYARAAGKPVSFTDPT
jgi:uncharacterized protein YndB with AHSA1/START domain